MPITRNIPERGGETLDELYINPFVVGTKHVFKTMLGIDISADAAFSRGDRKTTADITGIMGFTGDRRGTMSFSMSLSGALLIYTRLMCETFDLMSPEIMDAVGELTNIISGQARKELEKERLHLIAHVPMVFVGKNVEINFIAKGTLTTIPFWLTLDGKTEQMTLDYIFE